MIEYDSPLAVIIDPELELFVRLSVTTVQTEQVTPLLGINYKVSTNMIIYSDLIKFEMQRMQPHNTVD